MREDGNIDYSGFSLAEMQDALAHIDSSAYPINHQNLLAAIAKKCSDTSKATDSAGKHGLTTPVGSHGLIEISIGKTYIKRAAIFVLLLAISVVLFPLLAFGLALIGIPFLGNFLFFWPQRMLAPYGFVDREIGHSQAFLMDSAIFGAIVFWIVCALAYGYVLRNFRMRYAVLATYPVAFVVMFLFYWALAQFGYAAYLDGP